MAKDFFDLENDYFREDNNVLLHEFVCREVVV
jgi:hypothetical protein